MYTLTCFLFFNGFHASERQAHHGSGQEHLLHEVRRSELGGRDVEVEYHELRPEPQAGQARGSLEKPLLNICMLMIYIVLHGPKYATYKSDIYILSYTDRV